MTAVAALAVAACASSPVVGEDPLTTWQARPLPPDPALDAAAKASLACKADQAGELTVVLQDRRTASSAAVLTSGQGFSGSCLVTLGGGASGGSARVAALDVLTTAIAVDERSTGGLGSGTATLLGGRSQPAVARVQIVFPDGGIIDASVDGSHWLAWWPGGQQPAHVLAFDTTGAVLQTLDDSTPGFQQK
jgi:hypothetical protein